MASPPVVGLGEMRASFLKIAAAPAAFGRLCLNSVIGGQAKVGESIQTH